MAGIRQPIEDILAKLSDVGVKNQDDSQAKLYARVWNNQINHEEAGNLGYIFPKPAAFLEVINSPVFQQLGDYFQGADVGWKIHLVHEFYNADGTFEQDLTIFDLRDKIIRELSGYEPTACGPLVKVAEYQEYDHKNLYHYIIDFTSHFIDSKASPQDPDSGKLITKLPTTDLDVAVVRQDSIAPYLGNSPENNNTTNQNSNKYIIPQ